MAWRLICDRGQQIWKYLTDEIEQDSSIDFEYDKLNPNSQDKIFRNSILQSLTTNDDNLQIPSFADDELSSTVVKSVSKAINYYKCLQVEDGHWPGDYGGPMFLLPGAIITAYVTQFDFTNEQKQEMIKYLLNHQLSDGGWGTHIENKSTMFATVLCYVSLRLLGLSFQHETIQNAYGFIQMEGGAMFAPSWAKFWLCVLGVMPWEGVNSLFPELWLLPEWLSIHPSRYWCHCRMVYLPMSYVYSNKITGQITPLIEQLRRELYVDKYENIQFNQYRNSISSLDLYSPQTFVLKFVHCLTNTYELIHSDYLRRKANEFLLSYIEAEDEHTNFIDIGPVNKFINMLSIWFAKGRESQQFRNHLNIK